MAGATPPGFSATDSLEMDKSMSDVKVTPESDASDRLMTERQVSDVPRPPRRRRRGLFITALLLLIVLGGTGVAVGMDFSGGADDTTTRSNLPAATAKITRMTLYDSAKFTGTLGYGSETTVPGKLPGTITWLPENGATVKRGETLYRVDDSPVMLLYGSLPAYRTLSSGTKGADVKQFEQQLRALGYSGFTIDEEYNDATATAVKKWQKARGLSQTGIVEAGRVVFAPGEVRIANVKAQLGQAAQGDVITYSGTSRLVTVKVGVSDQRLAKKDAKVTVTLPDGRNVEGTVSRITTVIEEGSGDQATKTKIELSISLASNANVTAYDRASVNVLFTVSERRDVLVVPVAALVALPDGGYGVQVIDGSNAVIIRVETGLFANGRVEISGAGLAEGVTVGVPT